MWKNSVLALTLLVAGLLVWSCGDGSVDSLTDNELIMITRFPSTIDYDMLDSIVDACKKDKECWEKAKKSGEIYKGDFAKILRDSSGNIIIQEGDSAYIWKDGKKLPVFDIPTNNEEGDDDVTTSGSMETSGSSSKRSSASGYEVDEYTDGGDDPNSSGSGSGNGTVNHDRSSSSKKATGNSSSVDLSFLNSSSSKKVLSSSSIKRSSSSSAKGNSSSVDLSWMSASSSSLGEASSSSIKNERSSSSKIVVPDSVVTPSSSSVSEYVLSSSSTGQHGGGGGQDMTCAANTLSGSCIPSPSPGYKNETVTYTFTPDGNNKCFAYNEVIWYVNDPDEGASVNYWADPSSSSRASFTFDVKYSSIGDKKSVIFSMGGQNKQCNAVTIKRRCESNTYTCTRRLVSATNNLWKNDVKYEWTFSYSGCLEGVSYTWQGALSGSTGSTVTKTFTGTSPINQSVSLSIVGGLHGLNGEGSPITKTCDPAYAVYDPDLPPTCAVSNIVTGTGLNVAATPSSVTGCGYNSTKCSYTITEKGSSTVLANGSTYNGGALASFVGSSTDDDTLTYTLTLKNYLDDGYGSCDFKVAYFDIIPVAATTTFASYYPGRTYNVTVGNTTQNGFFCRSSTNTTNGVEIGTFDGKSMKMNGYYPMSVSAGTTYVFEVFSSAPADLKCGIAWN